MARRTTKEELVAEFMTRLRNEGYNLTETSEVCGNLRNVYPPDPLCYEGKALEDFLVSFKRALYFSLFAHAKSVAPVVSTKFEAWEWVKVHASLFLQASDAVSFPRREVFTGLAKAFDKALVTMGRAHYPIYWPPGMHGEF